MLENPRLQLQLQPKTGPAELMHTLSLFVGVQSQNSERTEGLTFRTLQRVAWIPLSIKHRPGVELALRAAKRCLL